MGYGYGLQYIGEINRSSGFLEICDPVVNKTLSRSIGDLDLCNKTQYALRNCKEGSYSLYYELGRKAEPCAMLVCHESLVPDDVLKCSNRFEHVGFVSTAFSHILCIVKHQTRDVAATSSYDIEEEAVYDARSLMDVLRFSNYEAAIQSELFNYLKDCIANQEGCASGSRIQEIISCSKVLSWNGFRASTVMSNHWGIDIKNHVLNGYSSNYCSAGCVATRNTLCSSPISAYYDQDGVIAAIRIVISMDMSGLEANYEPMYDENGWLIEYPEEDGAENDKPEAKPLPLAVGGSATPIYSVSDVLDVLKSR